MVFIYVFIIIFFFKKIIHKEKLDIISGSNYYFIKFLFIHNYHPTISNIKFLKNYKYMKFKRSRFKKFIDNQCKIFNCLYNLNLKYVILNSNYVIINYFQK